MKRDFIKGLNIEGLTDEVIDKIMAENAKDIQREQLKAEKSSQELENLKSELESNKQTLEQANAQIEKFKGMDVEGIKKEAEEWKTKYTEFENQSKADKEAYEKKLADQQYDFKLNEYVSSQKFTSEFAKKAYLAELKAQGFKIGEDGTLMGANDYTKQFQEKNPGVFVVEEAPKNKPPLPTFTTQTTQTTQPKAKMGLLEAMKLKNANPNTEINFN